MPRIDDVLSVFTPGVRLTSAQVGLKIGVSAECAVYYLKLLADKGALTHIKETVRHVDSKSRSTRYLWSLVNTKTFEEAARNVAPPAYRNRRLTETLTGYESSLSRFADLCMMVRR